MGTRTIVVASADQLLAEAAGAFMDAQPGWRTAAVVLDGLAAVAAVRRCQPDAVLVTDDLRRLDATTLAHELRRRWPEVTVVVMGETAAAGAATLPTDADADAVLAALSSSSPERLAEAERPERLDSVVLLAMLTKRERRILTLVADGRTAREIAAELDLSHNTVRTHMQNLYAKLGCHSRAEVVGFAARLGLLGTG